MLYLKSKYILYFPLLIYLVLVFYCGNSGSFNESTESGLFSSGMRDFEKSNYYRARGKFEMFMKLYPGSTVIDSAQFFLSESYYGLKEYISAASEYQNLIRNYPNSQLADNAQYKIAMSYNELSADYNLDQEYTIKAINEFITLIEDYPESDYVEDTANKIMELRSKLAKKRFENAKQYKKLGSYVAAKRYFLDVVEDYIDTKWASEAMFEIGECEIKLKDFQSAKKTFEEFIKNYPDHKLVENAKFRIQQLSDEKILSEKLK